VTRRRIDPASLACLVLCVLLGLGAAAPLWGPGMVNTRGGGDSPFLLQRTLDMADNLRHGVFPPRWMSHAAYDLGYPMFNHYAALPYYLSGGLAALGVLPLVAVQATQTLGFVLAALAMALWAGRLYSLPKSPGRHSEPPFCFERPAAVLLAVAAYTFAPFHLVNVYVRGDSLSEFYAFALYPLILWALDRLAARFSWGRVATAALAYGALILTHNISALIFSPFALLYAVWTWAAAPGTRRDLAGWGRWGARLAAPFLLGMVWTAWFWVPALFETGYGQMGSEFTAGYFHYSRHFRGLNLVQRTLGFDYSVAGQVTAAGPFAMGLVQAALAGAGAVAARRRRCSARCRYCLVGLLIATLMITPLSAPLWAHVPLLEITQFPWRFLSVQALFTAALTGWLVRGRGLRWALAGGLAAALIAAAMLPLRPDRLRIDDGDVTWARLRLYEAFTGNIGTTIRHEYLPRDVVPRPYISEAVLAGRGHPLSEGDVPLTATLQTRTPVRQVWEVAVGAPPTVGPAAVVAFPLHWWPGWRAWVDGAPAPARPMTGSGRLAVEVPDGRHTVELRLGPTPLRAAAGLVSLATALIGLGAGIIGRGGRPPRRVPALPLGVALGGLALAFGLPALLHHGGARAPEAFVFDFHQMPYPHDGTLDFGAARLTVAPLDERATPGAAVRLSLEAEVREDAGPLTATLRLVSPAEPRHDVPYGLAEHSFALPCGPACEPLLRLPEDLARGLYLVQVRLYGPTGELFARTPQGRGMGPAHVGAVRVLRGPALPADAPVLATLGDAAQGDAAQGDIVLHSVEAQQPDPLTLRLRMAWSVADAGGTPRNWSLSLRLLDAEGQPVRDAAGQPVQRDLQPGYGYLPTTLWAPGELVVDTPVLPLPSGLAPGAYTLRVIAYLRATMAGGGEVDVPIRIARPVLRDLGASPPALCEAQGVALLDLDVPAAIQAGEALAFHAQWHARRAPAGDVGAQWALVAPDGSVIGATEGPLAVGSRPSRWPAHTWVRAPVRVELSPLLAQGRYRLHLTLLPEDGAAQPCDLATEVDVRPRPRAFTVPELAHPLDVRFADVLRLRGYDLDRRARDALALTLWWQAQAPPARDYKRFVHLYDPATEQIVAQDDAMPRAWTYPTSWWQAGEVVSETVLLDLSAVPPGAYRLAVGWYDPATGDRLPTPDAGDRVLLTEINH
jgi:hypothetical protein